MKELLYLIISTNMAQKGVLAQPKFIKVKDIETARSGYNVYVKIVSAQARQIETRDGKKIPMVDAVVADETASAKAFFKGEAAHLIQKDNVVAIRNGVKRFIKDHISLQVDLFGRVTLEKAVTIASTSATSISDEEHKREERPRGERRDNRGGPRRDNRRREDGGERREGGDRREDRPRRDQRPREDRPKREDRQDRRPREDREDRPRRNDNRREDREDRKPREDRPRQDRPREDRPREDRRDNRDYDNTRRNNDRDVDRRENRTDYRRENRDNREDRPRRNDRDYDRTNNRGGDNFRENRPTKHYQEKREENRERRAPLQWNKLADITPGEDRLNINAKVISAQKVGNRIRCVIGDETGVSNGFFFDNEFLYEGEYIVLFNARSEVVKEHIEIQLDKYGKIEKSRRQVPRINEEFNLSQKAWVPIE